MHPPCVCRTFAEGPRWNFLRWSLGLCCRGDEKFLVMPGVDLTTVSCEKNMGCIFQAMAINCETTWLHKCGLKEFSKVFGTEPHGKAWYSTTCGEHSKDLWRWCYFSDISWDSWKTSRRVGILPSLAARCAEGGYSGLHPSGETMFQGEPTHFRRWNLYPLVMSK